MTILLLPGTPGNCKDTLKSLAAQSQSLISDLATTVPLEPALLTETGFDPVVRDLRPAADRPNLDGCVGDWVALVTVGDQWPDGHLETVMAQCPDADVLYGDALLSRRGRATSRRVGELVPIPPPEGLLEGLIDINCIPRSATLVRRAAWDSVTPCAGVGDAWDLDLWLQLRTAGFRFRLVEESLPITEYAEPWPEGKRLRYLLGSIIAYRRITGLSGSLDDRARRRHNEALGDALIASRYQDLPRGDRLLLASLSEVWRSPKTLSGQLLATLFPTLLKRLRPELVNHRPRTSIMDFLAARPLHDCTCTVDSLCHQTPLVTIGISCYDYGRYLAGAITSALEQTYSPIEVIVLDDGSTDDTRDVAESFGTAVDYVRREHAGVAASYNALISMATGDYLLFLDADDELHPLYVQELLGAYCNAKAQDFLAFAYCQFQVFGRERRITRYRDFDVASLRTSNYVNSAALLRVEALHDVSFDAALDGLEDWDFFLTLADRGWRGQLVDLPLLRYRTHLDRPSRSDTIRSRERQRELRRSILAKHNQFDAANSQH